MNIWEKMVSYCSEGYYWLCKNIGEVLSLALIICTCAALVILLCNSLGKIRDKKLNNKGTFAYNHPYLNAFRNLSIIAIPVTIICVALYYILLGLRNGIVALLNMGSKLDAVVIVALITGAVSLVSVIFSSVYSQIKSRQEYLAKKREEPYGQFIDMVYKINENARNNGSYTEKMMIDDVSKFSKQITLWGSHKVVNKWVEFRRNGANSDTGEDNLYILEDIMNEMRRDLGLRRTKKGYLLAFFVKDIQSIQKKKHRRDRATKKETK